MMMTIKVPCLVIDGLVLTQSVAIMEYLADRWVLTVMKMTIMTMMVIGDNDTDAVGGSLIIRQKHVDDKVTMMTIMIMIAKS